MLGLSVNDEDLLFYRVENQKYFHINSNANGSPYDLMRSGTNLSIGETTNPFFRFYETYTRSYPLRKKDGTTEALSCINFLRNVKLGNINPDDLPSMALEVAHHFLMLSRELIWENIRLNEFGNFPSRQKCLFLIKDMDHLDKWKNTLNFHPNFFQVCKVSATGLAFEADSKFLPNDSEPLPIWYDKAQRYWRGETTDDPLPEILFIGTITVENIINS